MTLHDRLKAHAPELPDTVITKMHGDISCMLFDTFPDLARKPYESQNSAIEAVFKALQTPDRKFCDDMCLG